VWQVVKRENIGIIEVMGLAILPARLMNEMGQFDQLPEYQKWLTAVPQVEPLDQLGYTFSQILKDCGVFKPDQESQAAFEAFVTGSLTGSESE
jgi:UDPglucose--hexose-1-phosphate uridylyltransferase